MTTNVPYSLLDMLSGVGTAPEPHPFHEALLHTHTRLQALDADLARRVNGPQPVRGRDAAREAEELVELFIDLLSTRRQLNYLLAADCCLPPHALHDQDADQDDVQPAPDAGPSAPCIVAACLRVFDAYGTPDALSSADLVDGLRHLPGTAEGRWAYQDLTAARLATLLRPYEVASRDITLGGRRRKSYRRSALLNAVPADCAC
ncbi:DUF3631 domain-containing protein [Streptomyces noboritoensis]|uniref:DUF3631 domain-containing protein n=1 Tax=Streptomyces noboritoensis TaxID=67337 RepID=A0ABV6TH24_9ACTN